MHKLNPNGLGPGVGGRANLNLVNAVPGFEGCGVTTHVVGMTANYAKSVILHEYAHVLGQGADRSAGSQVFGQYDGQFGQVVWDTGPRPYLFLDLIDLGWVTPVLISTNTLGLTVKDFYSQPVAADRQAYRVNVPGTNQYFLIVNHEGLTEFDRYGASPGPGVRYVGRGLLIWHVSDDYNILPQHYYDLELASGLTPDPAFGEDAFDINAGAQVPYAGSASDFFGEVYHEFGVCSNPNTDLVTGPGTWPGGSAVQQVASGVEFTNIYRQPNGDITLDVLFERGQNVGLPDGTHILSRGSIVPIQWNVLPCGNWVRILISKDLGGTFDLLADDVDNTGEYNWRVLEVRGLSYLIRVVSYFDGGVVVGSSDSRGRLVIVDSRYCSQCSSP